ncbi:MAG: C-terminal binding protein [Solibacillus sp.]|jgi:D-3-phosphoglycerate dehydrogenase / 2-oxoglutarate reductase|uniref:C-terminal binding protein n=1 Tax=unclassified Solibacillus TaxID=2637870 RepID=UPI0030FA4973
MFKVTLVDYEWEDIELEKRMFSEAGIKLQVLQSRDKGEIIEAAKNSDALLVLYANIDEEVLASAPNLQIVSRYGIGVNMIDVDYATQVGIQVANVNDYCVDEVSDHALASILAGARRLFEYNEDTANGNWDFKAAKRPLRASKAIVGLLGYGKIPKRLAVKLNAIGYNVLAFDPFVDANTMAIDDVTKATVEEIMEVSDFVSVHVPLIKATHHLIGENEFNRAKKMPYIINTARGPIIDEHALIKAIQNNQIAGAFLDVTEEEPLAVDSVLRKMKNVVLTPHAAWYSEDAYREIREKAVMNIIEKSKGQKPTYALN